MEDEEDYDDHLADLLRKLPDDHQMGSYVPVITELGWCNFLERTVIQKKLFALERWVESSVRCTFYFPAFHSSVRPSGPSLINSPFKRLDTVLLARGTLVFSNQPKLTFQSVVSYNTDNTWTSRNRFAYLRGKIAKVSHQAYHYDNTECAASFDFFEGLWHFHGKHSRWRLWKR